MQGYLHPKVAAEQVFKRESDPDTCHYAYGAVHPTAGKPSPHWCVRPCGHAGFHMDAKRYQEYRALARDRQRSHRAQEA
jgi:hypothetical protein